MELIPVGEVSSLFLWESARREEGRERVFQGIFPASPAFRPYTDRCVYCFLTSTAGGVLHIVTFAACFSRR